MLLVLGDIILFTFRIIFTLLKFIIKAIVKTTEDEDDQIRSF